MLTCYNDNLNDDNLEVVGLSYRRIEANIIMQYYLFPHWLSTNPDDDDHFAHFCGRIALLLLCHVPSCLCTIKLTWFSGRRLMPQCHVQVNK